MPRWVVLTRDGAAGQNATIFGGLLVSEPSTLVCRPHAYVRDLTDCSLCRKQYTGCSKRRRAGGRMKLDVELIAKAEAVLDRTLAYQAAQAVHELKATLGIEIQQINLAVSAMQND